MPKVLHIGPCDTPGGMANVMRTLAEYPPEGWEAELLSSHTIGSPWAKWKAYRRARKELIRRCRSAEERPDVVHLHTAADWSWRRKRRFAQMAHKAGIPNIVHIHSGKFDSWLGTPNSRRCKAMCIDLKKRKSHTVVLSSYWRSKLETYLGRISVVNNPVSPHLQPGNSQVNHPHMLLMGRNDPVKGHQFASKVCEQVRETFPELRLTMTGISSTSHDWISAVGWVSESEKLDLLQSATILMLPSAFEGQPLVAIEALSCGLPVLASDRVHGLPSAVNVAAFQDVGMWVDKVIQMLTELPNSELLLEQAKPYSAPLISEKWGLLYASILFPN